MSVIHPEPGLRVGDRYVLTDRIAGGGMGEVWRARDDVLGREVAVKLLRREYADDEQFLTRFRAEARHAASLGHAGIASVYDYGEVQGVAYLVMELVDGEPLSARISREGALPAAVAVPLVQQAAAGLQAAHDNGLVHRDIKPANLLIAADDVVKITDFGIARAGDQIPLTRTGEVMGTAQYLSPEQALGRGATPASDVYALGVVAYETLSGRRPFDGDSMVATALSQVNDTPEPLPADVPLPVARVVLQAMAKDPADRPASAAAFGAALGAALAQSATPGSDATQAMSPAEAALLAGLPAAAGAAAATSVLPSVGPVDAPPLTTTPTTPPATPERRNRRALLWGVLAILLVVALVALALSQLGPEAPTGAGSPSTSAASSPASATSSEPTSDSPTTPSETSTTSSPSTITLNPADYVGRDEKSVKDDLKALGLKTKSDKVSDSADKGTVLSLSPTQDLQPGDTVTLRVSDGKGGDTGTASPTPSPTPTSTATAGAGNAGNSTPRSTTTPTSTNNSGATTTAGPTNAAGSPTGQARAADRGPAAGRAGR